MTERPSAANASNQGESGAPSLKGLSLRESSSTAAGKAFSTRARSDRDAAASGSSSKKPRLSRRAMALTGSDGSPKKRPRPREVAALCRRTSSTVQPFPALLKSRPRVVGAATAGEREGVETCRRSRGGRLAADAAEEHDARDGQDTPRTPAARSMSCGHTCVRAQVGQSGSNGRHHVRPTYQAGSSRAPGRFG